MVELLRLRCIVASDICLIGLDTLNKARVWSEGGVVRIRKEVVGVDGVWGEVLGCFGSGGIVGRQFAMCSKTD